MRKTDNKNTGRPNGRYEQNTDKSNGKKGDRPAYARSDKPADKPKFEGKRNDRDKGKSKYDSKKNDRLAECSSDKPKYEGRRNGKPSDKPRYESKRSDGSSERSSDKPKYEGRRDGKPSDKLRYESKRSDGSSERFSDKPKYEGRRDSKPSDRKGGSDRGNPGGFSKGQRNDKSFGERISRTPFTPRFEEDYNEGLLLEGRNAVLEALNHGKPIDKLFIKKDPGEGTITVIIAKAKEVGVVISEVSKQKLDELSQSGNHQGVIASCPAHAYVEVSEILEIAKSKGEEPFVIVLDSITDPHNLGAIMRTADACGAHGIIIPKRRSAALTGIVSKTSAGAIEHVAVARVTNLNAALDELKEAGLWIACGEMHGKPYFKAELSGPIALVIGSEGEGISKLLSKKSDFSVQIPMFGKISSLNASVAAGLLMYEVVRQRKYL